MKQFSRREALSTLASAGSALLLGAEVLVSKDAPLIREGAAHLGVTYRVVDA